MKIANESTNEVILGALGSWLARARLEKNLTQAQLAQRAAVSKRTVERLESGGAAPQLTAFIAICRALGLAGRLELLVSEQDASERPESVPMAGVAKGWKRRRASSARSAPRAASGETGLRQGERQERKELAGEKTSARGDERAVTTVVLVAHELN